MLGLNSQEVEKRIQDGQINDISSRPKRTIGEILKSNLLTYFNFINTLLFVAVILTKKYVNGLFYLTVIINTSISVWHEIKAKKILDKLSLMIIDDIDVLRDGQWQSVKANMLVKDDYIRLNRGQQIPADCKIVEGSVEVNESILTGESHSLYKRKDDQLFAGTYITSGKAECIIVNVGASNYSDIIMKEATKYTRSVSKLHDSMEKMIRIVSIIIIPIGMLLFYSHLVRFDALTWQESTIRCVSALIGMIPEGLVILTSIALIVSTIRLARMNVLVQDIYSIEALARVDLLCLDKTGTITKGQIEVEEVIPLISDDMSYIEKILRNYVNSLDGSNPTDEALVKYFAPDSSLKVKEVEYFSSDKKYGQITFDKEGTFYIGADEFILDDVPRTIKRIRDKYTNNGKRVLLFARQDEDKRVPVAYIVMHDALKENIKKTVSFFEKQGVQIKVISGDDAKTASNLAMEAGIVGSERYVDGKSLNFDEIDKYTVFGRIMPDQKKQIIEAFKNKGYTVAMIGDGVNDVPAIKAADVGIAMASGPSAVKNTANIVLMDSDFGQVNTIVREGRRVINNITRSSSMYLVKTTFSILLSLYVIMFNYSYPFLPIQLTVLSSFFVGIPTFILQFEKSYKKPKGDLFATALRNSIPSGVAVLIVTMLCDALSYFLKLPSERYNTILVVWTAYIYIYTLYKVYYPLNKKRLVVLVGVILGELITMLLLNDFLELNMVLFDLVIIIPGAIIVPFLVASLSKAYIYLRRKYHSFRNKNKRYNNK